MAKDLVKLKNEALQLTLKGKLDRALKIYQKIVAVDPKDIKTWVKIGDLYKRMGRKEQAIEIYAKAAQSFALSGFLMQAISVNKMILELDPDHAETQQALAELYARKEGEDGGMPTDKPGIRGASNSVLELLKKKSKAKKEQPAKAPKPEPQAATKSVVTQEGASTAGTKAEPEPEVELEVETDGAAEATPSGMPQFDAIDLDLADELFDKIMAEEVVEIATEDEADQVLTHLPQIPLFSDLTPDEFMGVVEKLHLRRFDVGDKIIKEGEPGEAFYIVARGKAKVTKKDPKGREIEVATIQEGEFFGEFAFFSESTRHASVTVIEEMEALEIDRVDLADLIAQFPRIHEVMQRFYKERLIGTMLKISPIFQQLPPEDQRAVLQRFEKVEARIGTVLIRQGEEGQGLFVIASGEVAVTVRAENGQPIEVARLREGDFFGEISLITDQPTTANCIAVKDSLLYKLPREAFKELIAQYPQLLEVTADYADQRVKQTKAMLAGGEALQRAGMV